MKKYNVTDSEVIKALNAVLIIVTSSTLRLERIEVVLILL